MHVARDVPGANDFNLPIEGQDAKPIARLRDRFSHDRHLFHALLMLTCGHMFFEQVYRYDDMARRFPTPQACAADARHDFRDPDRS
jgi:hypothetical protein